MTNSTPARQPKGVKTGGQYATSAKAESEVDLTDPVTGINPADPNFADGESLLDVYDDTEECVSIGAHLTSVDEDGYCNHCGSQQDDETDEDEGDEDSSGSEPLLDFRVPGSSSLFEVRTLAEYGDDDDVEYELWRDGTYLGSFEALGGPDDYYEIEAAAAVKASAMLAAAAGETALVPFAKIVDDEARAACEEYATRYAPAPASLDYTPDWSTPAFKSARDVTVGERLFNDQVVTSIDATTTPGVVYLHVDGDPAGGSAAHWYNHGDSVKVHPDRVDLTDPDWFEVEARRALGKQVQYEEDLSGGTFTPAGEYLDELRAEVRLNLTRCVQPTNISPIHLDEPGVANGRAKVGDNVVFSQPMHGSTYYEVLGKRADRSIEGHDGTGVVWGENGEVEYILRDVETGHQTTTNLRSTGWRRIPAPGDHGPGAQAITL